MVYKPREGVEITTPIRDGQVSDWDLFEKLLDNVLAKHVKTESEYHPVLMSEPPINPKAKREKLTEIMFEKYNIPAFFLCKTPVLSAFANGRSTALVVDSGSTHTTVTPVHEGYAIHRAVVRTPLGGDYVTAQCRSFMAELGAEVVPSFMIDTKEPVKEQMPPVWTKKKNLPNVTESYNTFMCNELLRDFQISVGQVSATSLQNEIEQSTSIPTTQYEFPNGYNLNLTVEKFKLCEGLFDSSTSNLRGVAGGDLLSIPNVVINSVSLCDADIKTSLYSSVVIAGGNSLLTGFTDRLQRDLQHKTPHTYRVKLVQSSSSSERRFSSWIGGSILASLGTFQQMWISKQEYQDVGKNVVEKKCP